MTKPIGCKSKSDKIMTQTFSYNVHLDLLCVLENELRSVIVKPRKGKLKSYGTDGKRQERKGLFWIFKIIY